MMRKIVLAAAVIGAALTSTACSDANEDQRDAAAKEATAPADTTAGVQDAAGADVVLNANTTTVEQLVGLNDVSPELAQAIVSGQPYARVTDLRAKLLEVLPQDEVTTVLAKVFVPVNLNSASREEIALIPGMTDRMAHEFEEYRPYDDMNEFNREIGKYVDEAEVARLRNYVTL
jgi:DNA uptake protein ComE-like DNA-binding protein